MSKEISLRIILQKPVDGIVYGLQKGKGSKYETVQAQIAKGQNLIFDFIVHVKETDGALPILAGPFVQGPAGNRFIYIGIGSYAGQTESSLNGRIKVPLPGATFQTTLANEGNSYRSCTIPGKNAIGKPVFATVKPFSGWSI